MKNFSQAFQFFKDVKSEMAKVKWPTTPDFLGSTVIVLIIMIFFAIYLGSLDYLFSNLLLDKILSF